MAQDEEDAKEDMPTKKAPTRKATVRPRKMKPQARSKPPVVTVAPPSSEDRIDTTATATSIADAGAPERSSSPSPKDEKMTLLLPKFGGKKKDTKKDIPATATDL